MSLEAWYLKPSVENAPNPSWVQRKTDVTVPVVESLLILGASEAHICYPTR